MSALGVRREKAALSSGCKPHAAIAPTLPRLLRPLRAPPRPPKCANALRASRTVFVFAGKDATSLISAAAAALQMGLVILHRRAPQPLLETAASNEKRRTALVCCSTALRFRAAGPGFIQTTCLRDEIVEYNHAFWCGSEAVDRSFRAVIEQANQNSGMPSKSASGP